MQFTQSAGQTHPPHPMQTEQFSHPRIEYMLEKTSNSEGTLLAAMSIYGLT